MSARSVDYQGRAGCGVILRLEVSSFEWIGRFKPSKTKIELDQSFRRVSTMQAPLVLKARSLWSKSRTVSKATPLAGAQNSRRLATGTILLFPCYMVAHRGLPGAIDSSLALELEY